MSIKVKIKRKAIAAEGKEETPSERKERIFHGVGELTKLGKGILEEEPVEVSEDELTRKARRLIELDKLIKEKEVRLKELEGKIKRVKSYPLDAQLHFCSKMKDSLSGKLSSDVKE